MTHTHASHKQQSSDQASQHSGTSTPVPPIITDEIKAIPQRKKTTLLISAVLLAVLFNVFFLQKRSGGGIAVTIRVTLLLGAGYQIFGRAKLRNRRTTTLAALAWLYSAWFGVYTQLSLSIINVFLLIGILIVWLFCLSSQKNWRTRDDICTIPHYISNLISSLLMIPYL